MSAWARRAGSEALKLTSSGCCGILRACVLCTCVCVQDIVSGWPNELFEPYAAYVYNVFQSQNEVPLWFEPFLQSAQRRWKR